MHESYADVLESYLIPAEEGVIDTVKNTYKNIKNSKGGQLTSKTVKGIGTAYAIYSTAKGIGDIVKNRMSSSKAEEIERYIKNTLLSKYKLSGKLILVSDYSPNNSVVCALASKTNLSEESENNLRDLLSELKKEYKYLKYRIGSTESYELAVKIFF